MPPLADSPALRFLALAGDQLDEVRELDKALGLEEQPGKAGKAEAEPTQR